MPDDVPGYCIQCSLDGLIGWVAELASRLTIITLYGTVFFVQFCMVSFMYASVGPTMQSPLQHTISTLIGLAWFALALALFTSLSFRNYFWLVGPIFVVYSAVNAVRRTLIFSAGGGQEAYSQNVSAKYSIMATGNGLLSLAYVGWVLGGGRPLGRRFRVVAISVLCM